MKILILAGGLSPERCVSLSSGSLISAALRRRGHRVLMLDVYRGQDIKNKDIDALFTTEQSEILDVGDALPDLATLEAEGGAAHALIGEGVLELCSAADVVFIALHGAMGENGQIQATLDNFGIKYTGTGYAGSLLAMDKDLSKKLFGLSGVLTPEWMLCKKDECDEEKIINQIGVPCVVKPSCGGSSVGVSLVYDASELSRALSTAFEFEEAVIVEKMIQGREITCGVLQGRVLPPVEIIPKDGFYDYTNKYRAGATTELCPAPITKEELSDLSENTKAAFSALRLSGYARFDYIMDAEGRFWCLEANTLPGMTPTSLLPQEAAAIGIDYDELCERIVATAFEK